MSLVHFQASKIWIFFGKFTAELVLKSASGQNNFLEAPVFEFSNSLPYDLEESRVQRAFIGWVQGYQTFKNVKNFSQKFLFAFLSYHYEFTNCFQVLNFVFSNIIPRGVLTCKILTFQDQYFQKYKAQKIVKFSFLAFSADFLKILPSKLMAL